MLEVMQVEMLSRINLECKGISTVQASKFMQIRLYPPQRKQGVEAWERGLYGTAVGMHEQMSLSQVCEL